MSTGRFRCLVSRLVTVILLVFVAECLAASTPPADQLLVGRKIVVRNRPAKDPAGRTLRWQVSDALVAMGLPGAADDPRCNGSPVGTVKATLRFSNPDSGQDTGEMPLPCENWRLHGTEAEPKGYRYVDRRADAGPCRSVRLRTGRRISARCRSELSTPLDYDLNEGTSEGTLGSVLTIGGLRYCSAFDSIAGQDGSDGKRFVGTATTAPAECPQSSGIPPEITSNAGGWPMANKDYANNRTATGSSISSATVSSLGIAWRTPMPGFGGFGNLATNPIIIGDTVYLEELSSEVHAVDLATGALRWSKQLEIPSGGPNGVAVGYGRLFTANGQGEVVALDAATGDELWRTEIRRTGSEGIDIQPVVFDRRVYVSTVPISLGGFFVGGDTGVLHALDVATGEVLWSFDTVDSEDVWGNPSVNSGGGAWFPPAIDTVRGTTYWGTGNPAPFPGVATFPNGSSRPGPNLYTDSALAVDGRTGELLWYNQAVPHDLLDHDFVFTALAEIDSAPVVIGTGKSGTVHAFDADTGTQLWVTSVGVHFNDELSAYPIGSTLLVSPGLFGGVVTPPAVAGGVVYVAVLNFATPYQGDLMNIFAFQGLDLATSEVTALDLATGDVLWSKNLPKPNFGAATVVNDLLFTSTNDGTIYALDRASGATVWTDQPGAGINGWPAVAGDTIVYPLGVGAPELVAYRLN